MSVVHVGHPPNEWDGWESHLVHFHNFASLPSGKNELVKSPEFRSFGHVWRLMMYPGGHSDAEEGNISLYLVYCSEGDFSALFNLSFKKKSGGAVAVKSDSPHKFVSGILCGGHDFADRDVITHDDVLNNGTLTLEVRIKQHALSSTHQRTHHLLSVKFSVRISLC